MFQRNMLLWCMYT